MASLFTPSTLRTLAENARAALAAYGYLDARAQKAVRDWQSVHGAGLKVDGVYGSASMKALSADLPGENVPSAFYSPPGAKGGGDFSSLVSFAQKNGQKPIQGKGVAPGFQATRASVVNSFIPWSSPFENYTTFPYTDAEGLVTVGLGNMIDAMVPGQIKHKNCGYGTRTPCGQATPTSKALSLPWQGGSIALDWQKLKAQWPGVQSNACERITSARLPKSAIDQIIHDQLVYNEKDILHLLPNFGAAPSDAQMAVHSMAWAMGTGNLATFKSFLDSLRAENYADAAAQSHMQGVGIDIRNLANRMMLLVAEAVKTLGGDPDDFHYTDGLSLLAQVPSLALHAPEMVGRAFGVGWKKLSFWEKVLVFLGMGVASVGGIAFLSQFEKPARDKELRS